MDMYFDLFIHLQIAPTLTLTDPKLDLVSIKVVVRRHQCKTVTDTFYKVIALPS
jgi:hypothetical protein